MSRAVDITLLLVLIQGSIGFVNATGIFDTQYYANPSNNATFTITNLQDYTSATNTDVSMWSEIDLGIHWIYEATLIILKIILAVVFVLPTLVFTFGIPAILATFIQIGIYYYYALFYAQWKSNKPLRFYE